MEEADPGDRTRIQRMLVGGVAALEALANQPTTVHVTRALMGASREDLIGIGLVSAISFRRAEGQPEEELDDLLDGPPE